MSYRPLSIFAAAMLMLALMSMPYGYYTLMRVVVFTTCAIGAVKAHKQSKEAWMWILAGLMILFNPFIPVYLDRELWAPIDVVSAIVIFFSSAALEVELPVDET